MNSKQKELVESTRNYLRATGDPELIEVAKYLPLGMCAYLKFLNTMEAAEKATLPAGIKIKHIDFEVTDVTDERAMGVMLAANWVGNAVREAMHRQEFLEAVRAKFVESLEDATGFSSSDPDPSLRPQEDPALAPFSEQKNG
jgi:hypothetical protein